MITQTHPQYWFKRILLLGITAGLLTIAGTGCQTTKGLGRDVENLGENIQGN
jgi:predicted small secreted protein